MIRRVAPSLARKEALKAELLERLEAELSVLEEAQRASAEGATHDEAKPENSKDTRAIEQSYLARGQAARIEELRASVAEVRSLVIRSFAPDQAVSTGALVTVEEDDTERVFFVAPQGGGTTLAGGAQVVTPKSPIGRALFGRRAGDSIEVQLGGRTRELGVASVE